jgi:streptogramin lyase
MISAAAMALSLSLLSGTSPALALTGDITEFPIPTGGASVPSITVGPDGNLWFTEQGNQNVGRITPAGVITEFQASPGSAPATITRGPDGNLWFTEIFGNRIGRMTPSGTVTEFPVPTSDSQPRDIVAGPDGNLWFTEQLGDKIGEISTSGVILHEFTIPTAGARPRGITVGPDGNLWFAEEGAAQIGRITTAGQITEYPTFANGNIGITTGPDGNLWFTNIAGNSIGRITINGAVTDFPLPPGSSAANDIAAGPDGNLWFTEGDSDQIGRITTTGMITELAVPTANSRPFGITAGPDGNIWFTEFNGNNIGRLELTPACPPSTKANFRWHYREDSSAGGWSGTKTETCPGPVTMGPQAMEGNLTVSPGNTLQAGYDFTLPGNKAALTLTVSNAQAVFAVSCVSGAAPSEPSFTVVMPAQSYGVTNSQWYPSGDQSSPLVYQGSATIPDLCAGGQLSLRQGGTFAATLN